MKWSQLLLTGATKTKFSEVDHTLQTHWCHLYPMVSVLWKMRRHLPSQNHLFHHSACWLVHFLSDQREAPRSQGLLLRVFLNHQLSVQIHTHGLKTTQMKHISLFLKCHIKMRHRALKTRGAYLPGHEPGSVPRLRTPLCACAWPPAHTSDVAPERRRTREITLRLKIISIARYFKAFKVLNV